MSRFPGDPWGVLGLPLGSDRATVKARYRELALRLHPDTCDCPTPESTARFAEVTAAAEKLLQQGSQQVNTPHTGYSHVHRQPRNVWPPKQGRPSSGLLLAGLTFLAGCGVLVGSLWMHSAGGLGYQANTLAEAEGRLHSPSERRQRLVDIIMQERQTMAAKRKTETEDSG
ncbi:hypothetical protein ACKKBG_A05205 [Auxenochlorella protothecoides x Auxenochlorella symbiontica]